MDKSEKEWIDDVVWRLKRQFVFHEVSDKTEVVFRERDSKVERKV